MFCMAIAGLALWFNQKREGGRIWLIFKSTQNHTKQMTQPVEKKIGYFMSQDHYIKYVKQTVILI